MKFENAVEIDLENIVLLGDKDRVKIQGYDNKFAQYCHWCYLKDVPNQVFCLYQNILKDPSLSKSNLDNEIINSDNKVIDLKYEIYQVLDKILRENINKFVNKNINNISYFFDNEVDKEYVFHLYDIGKDILNKGIHRVEGYINSLLDNFEYKDIFNGLIELSTRTGKEHFVFDMTNMKFKENELDIFKKIYSMPKLIKILAYEQYKRGITPPFYNEVAKINEFLEDKKTVTLLLNDGEKKQVSAQISNILATNYKEFWINTQLNNMDITNLRAIGYGKKELIINTENLINIDKQLDEMIADRENKNLEIEELENEC